MAGEITNATQIVVPARTRLWLAPVGTPAPADATVAMPAGWYSVGLTTEDSLKFNEEPQFETVKSAQTDYPSRTFQTSDSATVEVDLQQWNARNFRAVFGGGTITAITPAGGGGGAPKHYRFAPPQIGGRTEVAACIEVVDGPKVYRYIIPRAMQMEGVQTDLQKAKEAILPLRLAVQGGDDADAWYLVTNDPAFSPPAPTIDTVTPSTGPIAGGTTVTITGADLDGATAVTFGGTAGTGLAVIDSGELTVTTPASTSGAKDVVVTTAGGTATKTGGFTYA
jgi:hypothetical protein